MTELLMRKEDREVSQLQLLEGFLREQNADNILSEIQGIRLEEALKAVVKMGSDKLVSELLNEHPWVLGKKYVAWVAWAIATYRSDEVTRHMIDKHPEVLKYKNDVAWAWAIAKYRSDEVIMHIIDKLIEKQPNMLGTETLIYNLAFNNRSEVLTYILLRLGKIKPDDVELTTLQFSVMLRELDYDYKERVVKKIFLDRKAIDYRKELNSMGSLYLALLYMFNISKESAERLAKELFLDRKAIDYRKELNSMGPLYLALLGMLNISKESAERLAKELSKAEGNVRKALPLRGLAYELAHKNGGKILNLFIENSISIMDALTVFPTVCELKHTGIIIDSEFKQVSDSIDKEAELSKLLTQKVEDTFKVKLKSDDATKAILDPNFLNDLFGLYAKYHMKSEPAEKVLKNVAKYYFEGGIEGFKEFKFGGHELAEEQLSDAYALREKLMNLDKLAVTYTSKRSIPYDSVKNDIDNFLNHKDELLRILDKIEKDANLKLLEIARSAKSKELASLLESKDLGGLTKHAFDSDDERVKARGIWQIKLLKARESLDYINNIVKKLHEINGKPKEEQEIIMEEIAKDIAEWVNNKGLEPLKMLKSHISKINKQQKQIDDGEQELGIAANALGNAISIVYILLNHSKTDGEAKVTAQITFDPGKILTFGRYGSSGRGNCQNSNGNVTYNQTLMSMVGDANQFMIIFYNANDTTKPLGFMQVHLLKSNEGMIFFMEEPYTNEPDKSTAMEEAARMLAQKIKNETGIDCFTYGEGDEIEELEVEVPRSYVSIYTDFAGSLDPGTFDYKIPNAKCLTSDPLFGLKR